MDIELVYIMLIFNYFHISDICYQNNQKEKKKKTNIIYMRIERVFYFFFI